MNTHAEKSQENKNHVVKHAVSKGQNKSTSTFQFKDNRPETVMQRKLQEMADGQFARPVQKQEIEEEELLQGKFKPVQRQEIEEEELLQGKFKTIQKQEIEEEELLQGKFKTIQKQEIEEEELLQGKFEPIQKQENNTGLPDNLKSGIENLSGYSMDDVKVHRNSAKPQQLQAHAYAQGTDIHLGSGQEKHLPHEAWHVVQQKQGRVKPTMQMQGKVNVNDDVGLEREADVMGAKALTTTEQIQGPVEEEVMQGKFENNLVQLMNHYQKKSKTKSNSSVTLQFVGDKHYWYRPLTGGQWTYAGAFKSHKPANKYRDKMGWTTGAGYEFKQGNSKTKYK